MTDAARKPAVFSVDDARLVVAKDDDAQLNAAPRLETTNVSAGELVVPRAVPAKRSGRFSWSTLLWSALGGLVTLAIGLAVTSLVEGLFARAPWLGVDGLVLAIVAGVALAAVVLGGGVGVRRRARAGDLGAGAVAVVDTGDRERGKGGGAGL